MITTIDRLNGPIGTGPASGSDPVAPARERPTAARSGVLGAFAAELTAAAEGRDLHLSGHALRRLEQRGIGPTDDQLDRLRSALDTLAGKGGRQSLVMLDQVAYVVHVPSSTVVTAVAPDESKESVFTQIDSVAIA